MADDGETKDDVKVPDGEVGEKIDKLFTTDEKDTSKIRHLQDYPEKTPLTHYFSQTSSFSLPWGSRLPLKPRRLLAVKPPPQKHYDIDLVVSNGIPSSCAGRSISRKGYPIAIALMDSLDFSGACILMVAA
jgi:hypothetical protein